MLEHLHLPSILEELNLWVRCSDMCAPFYFGSTPLRPFQLTWRCQCSSLCSMESLHKCECLNWPVDGGFLAHVLLWAEAVRVLVDSQFKQWGEHLAAEVAAVGQLLLVRPDVLQELIQLLEGLGAGLQHTLINLQGSECGYWSYYARNKKKTKTQVKFLVHLLQIDYTLSDYPPLSNAHPFIYFC